MRFNVKVRNQDGEYNDLAERIMNELTMQIDDKDFCVVYTLNPGYEWFTTPSEGALELEWECGDGMVYLQKELCAKHPAYDGQLLSDCLTEFMSRIGFDASRVDIDTTTGVYLPKKRGKEKAQFKPEDGTPAADFVKKLKEWFASTYTCRFGRTGKFEFKTIPLDGDGFEVPTIKRTYYMTHDERPANTDHVIYRKPKVELCMDEFYNEIWVVGEDKRNNKPIVAVYQDLPSQADKNSPKYVGRRLLMIVLTRLNTLDAAQAVCNRLSSFYGDWDVKLTFECQVDPELQKDDFIKINGVGATWRVRDLNYDVTQETMADGAINTASPVIRGMRVTATQWPVIG